MPYSTEELAKKFAASSDDLKKNLEGLMDTAEKVDKAFEKMAEQEAKALEIADRFSKASADASKSLTVFGHSGISAARGLKAVEVIARSTASALVDIGVGSELALSGFKSLSTGTSSFSTDVTSVTRGVEELIKQLKSIPTDIDIDIGSGYKGKVTTPLTSNIPSSMPSLSPRDKEKRAGQEGKLTGKKYFDEYVKQLKANTGKLKTALQKVKQGGDIFGGKRNEYIKMEVEVAKSNELQSLIAYMDEIDKETLQTKNSLEEVEQAVKDLIETDFMWKESLEDVANEARKRADEVSNYTAQLEEMVQKEAKSVSDIYKKTFAEGQLEAKKFADGLGANVTGMMAIGVAGAYLSEKLSDLVKRFSDTAVELSRFKSNAAAMEKTITGMSSGSLNEMREELYLNRREAEMFFDVVKVGVNELGMSKEQIMEVSKALRETFGGDQTERLRAYVDLLKEIPTLDTDLKITASMDDQTAAIFGLAEAGKMDVVVDLQTAGLLGGKQEKREGADMLNSAQKSAAIAEKINEFLMDRLYPEVANGFSEIVEMGTKTFEATTTVVGVLGTLRAIVSGADMKNVATMEATTQEIVAAVSAQGGVGGARTGVGPVASRGIGGFFKTLPKMTKVMGGVAAVGLVAEYGLGKFSDHLDKTGNEVGAAGASFAKSAVAIGSYAAAGAALGSAFPVIGTAIGATAGALIGFVSELDDMEKSLPTLLERLFSNKTVEKLNRIEEEQKLKLAATNKRMAESGLSLQVSMQRLKNETNSLKFKAMEFEKTLGDLKLGNFQQIGGSVADYNNTLRNQVSNLKKIYHEQMKVAADNRRRIMADAKMQASERLAALKKVHEVELNAAKEFATSMDDVIDALYKTPERIQAGLRLNVSKGLLDYGREAGGLSEAEKDRIEIAALNDAMKNLDGSLIAGRQAAEEANKAMEQMSKSREDTEKEIAGRIIEIERTLGKERIQQSEKDALEIRKKAREALVPDDVVSAAKRKLAEAEKNKKELGDRPTNMEAAEGYDIWLRTYQKQIDEQQKIINKSVAAEVKLVEAQREIVAQSQERKRLTEEEASLRSLYAKDGKIDLNLVKKQVAAARKSQDEINKAISEAQKEVGEDFQIATAQSASKLFEAFSKASTELEEKKKKLDGMKEDKGSKSAGERNDLSTEIGQIQTNVNELQESLLQVTQDLAIQIQAAAKNLSTDQVNSIVEKMKKTNGSLESLMKIWDENGNITESILASTKRGEAAASKLVLLQQQRAGMDVHTSNLSKLVESSDAQTLAYKALSQASQDALEQARSIDEIMDQRWRIFSKEITDQERELRALDLSASITSKIGDGMKERLKFSNQEMKLQHAQYRSYMSSVKEQKEMISQLKARKKTADDEAKLEKERLEKISKTDEMAYKTQENIARNAENAAATISMMLANAEKRMADTKETASNIAKNMKSVSDQITEAVRSFDESMPGLQISSWERLSDALVDSAGYADNLASASRESFEFSKQAALERLKAEREIVQKTIAMRRANVGEIVQTARTNAAEQGGTPEMIEAAGKLAQAAEEAYIAEEERLGLMQAETKAKKSVVESAKKSQELKDRELNTQQDLLDDATSFVSEFGGTFSSLMELQNMSVGVAKQQLDAATETRDRLVEAGVAGQELFEANAEVAKKTLALRRQEMGIQKSMMDRLLGAVFGQLREGFGARKMIGSDQSLLGVMGTRMKTAAGIYMNVPGGDPGTIAERSLKRQTAAAGGVFSKGGTGATGFLGSVEQALKTAPAKSPLEAAIGKATASTADNTKKTAEATEATARFLTNGSFKAQVKTTADNTKPLNKLGGDLEPIGKTLTENLQLAKESLRKGINQEKLDKIAGLEDAVRAREFENPYAGAAGGIAEYGRVMSGERLTEDMAKELVDQMGGPIVSGVSAATAPLMARGGVANAAANTSVVPPTSGQQVASAGGSGGAAASSEGVMFRVTGEMTVKFDNAAFKEQVTKVVGTIITSPEIAQSIQKIAARNFK